MNTENIIIYLESHFNKFTANMKLTKSNLPHEAIERLDLFGNLSLCHPGHNSSITKDLLEGMLMPRTGLAQHKLPLILHEHPIIPPDTVLSDIFIKIILDKARTGAKYTFNLFEIHIPQNRLIHRLIKSLNGFGVISASSPLLGNLDLNPRLGDGDGPRDETEMRQAGLHDDRGDFRATLGVARLINSIQEYLVPAFLLNGKVSSQF